MNYRRWTDEDVDFLMKNYGRITLPVIAEKLGRSVKAIENKRLKLKLGRSYEAQGSLTATELGNAIGRSKSVVYEWIKKHGLKSTLKITSKKRKFRMIKVSDFWEFAKNNPGLMKWELYGKGALLPEPTWLDKEIERYYETRIKNKDKYWSKTEDCYLLSYYAQGKQVKEISKLMGRSINSVFGRLKKLNVKKRVVKIKWKKEEDEILISMRKQGKVFEEIGEELGRSKCSAQRRYERIMCRVC